MGETDIRGTGPFCGTIAATAWQANGDSDNGFITEEPVDSVHVGRYGIVTLPDGQTVGHRFACIVPYGTGSLLVTETDPGLELDADETVRQRGYPHQRWCGKVTIRIDNIEEVRS
jgi:hypothetical protein